MKGKVKSLIICILIPLAVGGLAAWLTWPGMAEFEKLKQPPLSPPGWVFPVVWTVLYTLMGIASWRIWQHQGKDPNADDGLSIYVIQLIFNFFWTLFFFYFRWYLFAFIWLVVIWWLIFRMIQLFRRTDRWAARLICPYLLWVTFAGYLNLAIYLLNG